jgi:hypothetical protein
VSYSSAIHLDPTFGWKEFIAVLALVVSVGTAYLTLIRAARLSAEVGDTLLLHYGSLQTIRIMPELALYNSGVAVAVVTKISAKLVSLSDSSRDSKLTWTQSMITEFKTVGTDALVSYENWTRFDGYPSVFFVSKAEAINKRLALDSAHPYPLPEGEYLLELNLRVTEPALFLLPRRTRVVSLRRKLLIRDSDEAFLVHHQPKSEKERSQNLLFRYNADDERFVSRLPPFWKPDNGRAPASIGPS